MITKCKACEIEANDELVKQMPLHTCGKDGPVENAMPKTADKDTPMDYKQFEGHTPGKRCKMNGEEIYICHIIEGNEALDYEGKCYGCGAKRAISFDQENQTEADAARAYLIREGLDPDQLVKEGLVFIKAVQENVSLKLELQKQKELKDELVSGLKYACDLMKINVPSSQRQQYVEWIECRDLLESLIKKSNEI